MARTHEINAEISALRQQLNRTESTVSEFTEGLFNVFKESTTLNLLANLIQYMVNAKKSYAETITQRIQWQSRIAELEAQLEDE